MSTVLGLVGISNKGTYNSATAYKQGNFVYYNGSTYLCINESGCTGVTPTNDGTNWQYLAVGTTENKIASTSGLGFVKIGDGITVASDGTISAQSKIDTWAALGGGSIV